jgi:hypothetical protein
MLLHRGALWLEKLFIFDDASGVASDLCPPAEDFLAHFGYV